MDVFEVRERLVSDYRQFTSSFVDPRDAGLAEHVRERMDSGEQWPDPYLSLNPNFAPGGTIGELVEQGLLHPECERIFRIKDEPADPGQQDLRLYRHQREAVEAAGTGQSYVLTTGTGSGKRLAYIIPIVNRVLRDSDEHGPRKGVKAIVVYPMNALANSQHFELEKFLTYDYSTDGQPVTFARYTGQESDEQRQRILNDPPDILLTNYVMLDLRIGPLLVELLNHPDTAEQAEQLRQVGQHLGSLSAELLARAAELDGRVVEPPGRVVIDARVES